MQEFYRAIHAVVGELMYATTSIIALYDEERQLISWPYYVDEVDPDIPDPNQWDDSAGRRPRHDRLRPPDGQATAADLSSGRGSWSSRARSSSSAVLTEETSWLGVPLKAERPHGRRLAVQSYTKDVRYTEQDEELLAFVGQHVGAALSRARAIEETRQRNAELALINSVQEALAGELELQAIYDAVGDRIREVFDAQVVDIGIYDEASGADALPVHDRARRALPGRADRADRLPQARDGDARAADDQRERSRRWPSATATRSSAGEMPKAVLVRPAGRGRQGDRCDLPPEHRPRACVHRVRPAAPGDARREPQRRAGERAARPRDAAAERRARADQQRPGGDRGRARSAGDLRRSSATRSRRSSTRRSSTSASTTRPPGSSASRTRSSGACASRTSRCPLIGFRQAACSRRGEPLLINEACRRRTSGTATRRC